VRFHFDPRLGFAGHHEFGLATDAGGTIVRRTLEATPRGRMGTAWPLFPVVAQGRAALAADDPPLGRADGSRVLEQY
jgi:hypothetical protein